MSCLMALTICTVISCSKEVEEEASDGYVNLGLSSGTKWKTVNEVNAADADYAFFTYDEAIAQYGNKLPSREKWMELVNECEWTWTGMGYKVVGPNGKSISLPAEGYRRCDGSVYILGSNGYYWSSTPYGSEKAWYLYFISGSVHSNGSGRCCGRSVRLVQD